MDTPIQTDHFASGASERDFLDFLGSSVPGNWSAKSQQRDGSFEFQAGVAKLGDLSVASTSQVPISYENAECQSMFLSFSTNGRFEYSSSNVLVEEMSGCTASFLAAGLVHNGRSIGVHDNSAIALFLDAGRLEKTYLTMAEGAHRKNAPMRLSHNRALQLRYGNVDFDSYMRHLIAATNSLTSLNTLCSTVLEDLYYRWSVMLLEPELFVWPQSPLDVLVNKSDIVCEYIMANLNQPLTLTDLEEVAGISARALQLQFLKRFGCSPMAWLRDRRLDSARKTLLTDRRTTVTKVATDLYFYSPSRFSAAYKQRFGELPSVTRTKI